MRPPLTAAVMTLAIVSSAAAGKSLAFVAKAWGEPSASCYGDNRQPSRARRRGTLRRTVPTSSSPTASTASSAARLYGKKNDDRNEDDQTNRGLDMESLARRIEAVSAAEERSSEAFEDGLRRRARDLAAAEVAEAQALSSFPPGDDIITTTELPVLAFDALLPGQRLSGSSEDPTFSRLLRELGLGGIFVMVSVDQRQRKLRRSGVVCRVEMVDIDRDGGPINPTAVTFTIVGRRRCRVVGPSSGMAARVGRWRRGYDPDGEETRLGWGMERFVDMEPGCPGVLEADEIPIENMGVALKQKSTEWSQSAVDCNLVGEATMRDDNEEKGQGIDSNLISTEECRILVSLIDRWIELASDQRTFDNVDVVASTRRQRGEPGLRVDPARLLRNVMSDLGERPSPSKDPTSFAFWGAALINPLPPLGVAPEIRGMMLEATDAQRRLKILKWGLMRSIENLEGTSPL